MCILIPYPRLWWKASVLVQILYCKRPYLDDWQNPFTISSKFWQHFAPLPLNVDHNSLQGYLKCSSLQRPSWNHFKVLLHSFPCSFYNWETQTSTSNPTPNYQVIAENASGLLFKNKRDRKILNVDPKSSPGDNSTRVMLDSPKYIQIVIYDHITRRKT